MMLLNCRYCDYNPCMCGRKDYMTESERRYRERIEYEKRWEEDSWALPDYDSKPNTEKE